VEGFRDHLKSKEDLSKLLDKTEKERSKLLDDKSKASANAASGGSGGGGGFGRNLFGKNNVEKLNEDYNKKDEQVMQLADQLSKFSRALSLCEIERFQSHRSEVFNRLLGTIIACNIHVSSENRYVLVWLSTLIMCT
jgi:predicted nuclease with TOPRIM domain